jgi:hypothetical protein
MSNTFLILPNVHGGTIRINPNNIASYYAIGEVFTEFTMVGGENLRVICPTDVVDTALQELYFSFKEVEVSDVSS